MPEPLEPIYFYHQDEIPYGPFSNFSAHPFWYKEVYYPTSEHYFQAHKFIQSPKDFHAVVTQNTPNKCAKAGRDRSRPLRDDWESVKDNIMKRALWEKFQSHPQLQDLLLATGDAELIENTTHDYYWGNGTKGTGKNMLGILLMHMRSKLQV